jgi:hypothetical protein
MDHYPKGLFVYVAMGGKPLWQGRVAQRIVEFE